MPSLKVGSCPLFCLGRCIAALKDAALSIPEHGSRSSIDRIQELLSPILWTLGLELVDVVCVGQGSRSVVRVLIDKPGGVTVSDCERAHLAVGPALDVADPFPHAYTLEVSSPGIDRPFKRLQDYQRAVGKRVSVKLKQPLDGQWRIIGELVQVDEDAMVLTVASKPAATHTVKLDRHTVAEARLVIEI
ncbi:MAG: Ribosome maturation factor RimP [Nitrospira sp.]|nr:MAG: Ribosome maturation factor RimP [Nitrospira sp.]